uniref:Glycoside hydrolase family 71 protein n=1 Tax=Mycena chlorophos TaxID=658473 RepID=A0ABQ0LR12_MYCCL|nr:predicted protein [Mycena chlorophos]
MRSFLSLLTAGLAATLVNAAAVEERASVPKLVFCHFMIGIESDRTSSADYDADMQRAKAYGIDAFALNIGVDPYTDTQLNYAYQSAANNGMQVFISFDFNWWNTGQATDIGNLIAQYGQNSAQLKINGAVVASSFAGDGLNVAQMKAQAAAAGNGMEVFFIPNFHPTQSNLQAVDIDGALNWLGWPNNGNNKAPDGSGNVTVLDGDEQYMAALGNLPYLAPASAWFSTHYGPEVSYSKEKLGLPLRLVVVPTLERALDSRPTIRRNRDMERLRGVALRWAPQLEASGRRWQQMGQRHAAWYVDALKVEATVTVCADAWLEMAKPYIAAWKAGATSVDNYITSDQIIYWYRPTLASLDCDATDTCEVPANNGSGNYFLGRPDGWQQMPDEVFVVTLLTEPGTLTVNSGSETYTYSAPAGAQAFTVPMSVGQQSFALARNGVNALAGVSLKNIVDVCICGIYNFNAFTGAVPPLFVDPLGPDGLISLTLGLHVSTCSDVPSLATSAPPYTGPGGGGTTTTSKTTTSSTTTTSPPTTTTTTTTTTKTTTSSTSTNTCNSGCTITASSQIYPTNCLQPGCVWSGPAGQATPDHCDTGGKPACTAAGARR